MVDGREGLIPGDQEIAAAARETGVPVILAINKMDDRRGKAGALELYQMGFESVVEISAEHGQAVGDLLEVIVAILPQAKARAIEPADRRRAMKPEAPADETKSETAIAIVGRPNAGKSSLVNRLLREERMIVSEMPGTTRDSVDSLLQVASPAVPHCRYRRHSQARQGVEVGAGRNAQRDAGQARDRTRRRRRAGDRRHRRVRPIRTARSPAPRKTPAAA